MKGVAVKLSVVRIGGRHPVLTEVLTDQGLSGIGEAAVAYGTGAWAAASMIKELAEGWVLGKDPARIEALWMEMYDHTFWAKGGRADRLRRHQRDRADVVGPQG
jgi:galactonate dehydratase